MAEGVVHSVRNTPDHMLLYTPDPSLSPGVGIRTEMPCSATVTGPVAPTMAERSKGGIRNRLDTVRMIAVDSSSPPSTCSGIFPSLPRVFAFNIFMAL